MSVTVPDWADTLLDVIGVSWPNVDEDAYRDMAKSLREFAEDIEDDGQLANNHVQRLISSGHGEAIEALSGHWDKVKGKHIKDIASAGRTIAGALDSTATVIEGMKVAALAQLTWLAGKAGIAMALIPVTGGLSALIGAGAIRLAQEAIKRLIKEASEEAISYLLTAATEPAVAALENLAADLIVQVGATAMGLQDGVDLNQTKQAGREGFQQGVQSGKESLNLASAGDSGVAPKRGGKGFHIEHGEHDTASTKLNAVSTQIHGKTRTKLSNAKSHHGRTRGRDDIASAIDPIVDKAMGTLDKAVRTMGDHVGQTLPKAVRQISKDHKTNDADIKAQLARQRKGEDGTRGGQGRNVPGQRKGDGGPARTRPNSLRDAGDKPRRNAISLEKKVCKGDPIDIATGEMTLPQTDLALPGLLPLVLRRTHLSEYHFGQWFGRSWASTLDERIELDPLGMGAVWAREDGSLLVYPTLPRPDGPPVLPLEGARLPLTHGGQVEDETWYQITDPHRGITRSFGGSPYRVSTAFWLARVEDSQGHRITFGRGPDGAPSTVTHSGGYSVQITVVDQRVTSLALRSRGAVIPVLSYGHDQRGNLSTVVNSTGRALAFTYDHDDRITSWTDRNDSTFRYVYDTVGRVVETVGPDGFLSSTISYDTEELITRYTDATGATTTFQLNELHQVIAETDPQGNTTRTEYDIHDRLLSSTNALGETVSVRYDTAGRPTALLRADGLRTSVTYNALGLPHLLTEPDGALWQHFYDEHGNRTAVTNPAGDTTHWTYGPGGHLTSVTDALGQRVHYTCTDTGLPLTVSDPAGQTTSYEYDCFGRLVLVTNPLGGRSRLEWTTEGHLSARTNPNGDTERWAYDGEGNCTRHTDVLGQTTRFSYTHFDLISERVGPDGARFTFAYDRELRLTEVANPEGLKWSYTYDVGGRLIAESDFDGRTRHYCADALGRTIAQTNAMGQRISYSYDSAGSMVEKDVDGRRITFENDPCGRLLRAAGLDGNLSFHYDRLGRLLGETVNGRSLTSQCDAVGRRIGRTTPSGAHTSYSYDLAGHRDTLTAAGQTLAFDHDAVGRETERRLGQAFALRNTWDPAGLLLDQTLSAARSQEPLRQRTFRYRADGFPTAVSDHRSGPRELTLDQMGRVTAIQADDWAESYGYDLLGNQTRAVWPDRHTHLEERGERSYSGTRLTQAGRVRYEYDAEGRVVLRQKTRLSRKPETWRYTWDAEDRLTGVITPDGTEWRYLHDPLGRRIAKQRMDEDRRSVVEETLFTWDGTTLTEQTTRLPGATGALTLTWEHQGTTPLAQTETKYSDETPQDIIDQRFFAIVTDGIGTPTELIDADGEIAWHTKTTLWGATTWTRDATAYTPLRFPGQYFDPETELHHNYFRHYDPGTARYLTSDPLGLDAAPNPMAYVDNPYTLSDPLGLAPCDEADVTWGRRVQYGAPGPGGRATSMSATIGGDMTGGKTRPRVNVAGWVTGRNYNRTHLLGAQIGGSNRDPRNFVTMHRNANSPVMVAVENQIREAVDKGETIQYTVTPIYRTDDPSDVIPVAMTLEAHGNRGFTFQPYESDSTATGVNHVTVLNVPKP